MSLHNVLARLRTASSARGARARGTTLQDVCERLDKQERAIERLARRIENMNQAEQDAFKSLSDKAVALTDAVKGLSIHIAADHDALAQALASNDTAGVLEAAAALSAKLDEGIATAQAALALPVVGSASASTPVHPSTDLPGTPDHGSNDADNPEA